LTSVKKASYRWNESSIFNFVINVKPTTAHVESITAVNRFADVSMLHGNSIRSRGSGYLRFMYDHDDAEHVLQKPCRL
jgi:hypothetical protein